MKKTIKAALLAAALIVVAFGNVFAQEDFASRLTKTAGTSKNNLTTAVHTSEENAITTASLALTNPAIATKFSALFPSAVDVKWAQIKNDFWVSFTYNGQKSTASFAPKASLNYLITGCNLDQLPTSLTKAIKSDYDEYQVFSAVKIEAHDAVAYQVVLENQSNYVTLKYTPGEVEEIQVMKKSPAK